MNSRFFSRLMPLFVFSVMLFSCKKESDPLTVTFTPANPSVNTSVQFTSSQSGGNWQYNWNFGDSHTNSTNTPTTSHTYSTAGTYNVTLNIYVGGNPSGFASTSVTVQ